MTKRMFKRMLGILTALVLLVQMVIGSATVTLAVQTSNITAEGHAILEQIKTMTVKHDGLVVRTDTLEEIKAHIEAGDEPWLTNFNRMKSHASASLSYTPTPYEYPSAGLYGTNDEGHAAEQADARAAYTHALMWALTGDERYAEKSIEIMNAWSYVIKGHKGGNWYLQTAWVGSVFPLAAEIIRSTYDGWAEADIEQFKYMLSTAYLPELNNRLSYGNRGLTVFNALVAIGVFCDDRAAIYQGVYNWLDYVPAYFYIDEDNSNPVAPTYCLDNDDKPTKEEYLEMHSDIYPNPEDSWLNLSNNPFNLGEDRAVATQDLATRFYNPGTFYDGICGETGRDLGHSEMAYAAAIYTAEIMYNQGFDLYSIYADRFVAFSETHSALRLGAPIPDDLYGGHIEGLGMSGTYEVGYNHLHNRMNIDMPRTTQYIRTAVRNFGGSVWPTNGLLATGLGSQAGLHMNWESLLAGQPLDEIAAEDYAPALEGVSLIPGLSIGTATFDTLPEDGNYYYVKGAAGEYEHPQTGDIATYYIYPCDPEVSFEAKAGEHIFIVNVDDNRNVLEFADITLTDAMIRQWPEGTVTLTPTDDAYARGSRPDQCTGTWNTMDISTGGGWGYLKFNISAMDSCSKALLQLTRTATGTDKGNNLIEIYGVDDTTWTETTITWNNKPAITTGALVSVESFEPGKTFTYDVTSYVRSELAKGKTTITLVFKPIDDCPSFFQFHSKEASAASNRPSLKIAPAVSETTLAPELGGFVWEQGTRNGTTLTTDIIDGIGTHKYVVGEAGEYTRPTTAEYATDYPNILRANQNIYVEPDQHIYIVTVDSNNKITAWSDVTAKEANIFYTEAIPFTFIASDDAAVRSNNPDQAIGTWAGMDNNAYLKFTINDIEAVKQAIVYIYTHNESTWGSGNLANLQATYNMYGVESNDWVESTITYNNAPDYRDTPIVSVERPAGSTAPFWVAFDVTDFVKERFAAGETTVSFYTDRTANMNYTWQMRAKNDGNLSYAPYIYVVPDTSTAPNVLTPVEQSTVTVGETDLTVPEDMTAGELRAQLSNRDEIVIADNGTELADTAVLTDGITVTMYDNGTKLDEKTVAVEKAEEPDEPEVEVMLGDINGDKKLTSSDVLSLKQYILGLAAFDEAAIAAMDIDASGEVNSADLLMLEQHMLGIISII